MGSSFDRLGMRILIEKIVLILSLSKDEPS